MKDRNDKEEEPDFEQVQTAVLKSLGTFISASRAAHVLDTEGFCVHAAEERGAEEHLIWAAAE